MNGMFDEEADTVSLDAALDAAFELVRMTPTTPIEVGYDTVPTNAIEFEDTPIFVVNGPGLIDGATTERVSGRPATNADWPPAPKPPGTRTYRRAGMYKAITGITKLTKI